MSTINDELWQDGNDSVSFNGPPPITFEGTFVRQEAGIQTDIVSKEAKLTKAGVPMRKVVVTLADKDGALWDLHVRNRSALYRAIKGAIVLQGVPGLRPGDWLSVTYTSDGKPSGPGLTAPKEFTVALSPGSGTVPPADEGEEPF